MSGLAHARFIALWLCLLPCLEGARVLMVPFPFGSHVGQLVNLGEGLIERGHEVYATSSPTFPDLPKYDKSPVEFILYKAKEKEWYEIDSFSDVIDEYIAEPPIKDDFRASVEGFTEMCTNPLRDQDFFAKLKSFKFDLAVVDAFPNGRCMLVLIHRLGIPYISSEALHEHWLTRNPSLPSAWPINIANHPLTENMNFWERLGNLWEAIDWANNPGVPFLQDDFLEEFFYETPPVPLNQLAGNSALWLLDYNFLLDYPRPSMPNEIHIGGMGTKPAKSLPADVEEFMGSNPKGVIVVSFGSLGLDLPPRILEAMFEAFKQTPYNVIMRHPGDHSEHLPRHIKLMKWMPQNDLLAHNNTKLFITHCGAGGQNEALYNAVPMIGMPMFADQPYNAKRIVHHGFGLYLKLVTLETSELVNAMQEIITNDTYKKNIQHASNIFRDQPRTPRETALYWIEHVLKYGGAHLHSHALDMPWYEYLMLDIFAFLSVLLIISLLSISIALLQIYKFVFKSSSKSKKE